MISRKGELMAAREQQLAALRAKTGQPERMTLPYACAVRDEEFTVTFARLPPANVFSCEKVEPSADRLGRLKRLQPGSRREEPMSVAPGEIDLSGVICGGCGHTGRMIYCGRCRAYVCGRLSASHFFRCRSSCGASGHLVPLDKVDGSRGGGSPDRIALKHSGVKALLGKQ